MKITLDRNGKVEISGLLPFHVASRSGLVGCARAIVHGRSVDVPIRTASLFDDDPQNPRFEAEIAIPIGWESVVLTMADGTEVQCEL